MIFSTFKEKKLSMLGFGTMRLPTLEGGAIDEAQVAEMMKYALDNGVNYFDTAYPYHGGMSEEALREAVVKRYPRDKFTVTDKMPLWDIKGRDDYAGYNPYCSSGTIGKDGVFYDQKTGRYCDYGTSYSDKGAERAQTMAAAIKATGAKI